jgi:dCMP deaminase
VTRPPFPQYFLGIAGAVSARGECVRSRVGAVLVVGDRVVATGYNGVARGAPSCLDGVCPRALNGVPGNTPYDEDGPGRCVATHAEQNALDDADARGVDLAGARVYVTKEPCERCARLLLARGIPAVWPR